MSHFLKTSIIFFLFLGSILIFQSCKQENVPTLTTTSISAITATNAMGGGAIISEGSGTVVARGVCWSTGISPTIADNKTTDGAGTGSFSSNITGLDGVTKYYVRAYASNKAGTGYGNEIDFTTTPAGINDIDGNTYNIVTIGTQVWMKENLKTTKYNDGTPILNITVNATWTTLNTSAYSNYDNTPSNSTTYGRLYNWYAVDNNGATKVASNGGKNVCPTGWHVPTDTEWTTLTNFLGGESVAGGKLKETGTAHWQTPNTGATNEIGFSALPGGYRDGGGPFTYLGTYGYWWSTTEYSSTYAYFRFMNSSFSSAPRNYYNKQFGFSVRCIKDN